MLPSMSGKTIGKPEEIDQPTTGADATKAPKSFGKKKLIVLAAPVLLIGILAGLWFTGVLSGLLGMKAKDPHAEEASKPTIPVFVDLPDMIANLNSPSNKPAYIKLQARLELAKPEDADKIRQQMPRLQDIFQTYLREMRPEELRGSPGIYRLREELLGRANVAVAPVKVNDILFTQLLIQ
jgi:flagellar FliL protein